MYLFQWLKNGGRQPDVRVPKGPPTPPVRRRYRFFGHVQFVGFRYEAKMTADQLNLTGWAQNQGDGTVIVELEGEEARIDEFLRVMQAVPRFEITEIQTEDLPLSGTETAFEVVC